MAAFESVYARAFADVAVHDGAKAAEKAMQELRAFADALGESRDLREVLSNPAVPEKQKVGVLTAVSQKLGASEHVRNFLAVITKHGRMTSLKEILDETQEELNRRLQVLEAEIVTARPLDAHTRHEFANSLKRLAGHDQVRAHYSEDPGLLGGAMVKIGSTVYDGSVRGQLQRLKQRLAAG